MKKLFSLLVALLCVATVANAQTSTTWTGNNSPSWGTNANWSNKAPNPTTDAIIPNGVQNYPTITTSATCRKLTIQSGSSNPSVTIAAGVTLTASAATATTAVDNSGTLTRVINA